MRHAGEAAVSDPGVITLADIHRGMMRIGEELVKNREQLAVISQHNQAADQLSADHETRLRMLEAALPQQLAGRLAGLESWRAKVAGIALAAGIGTGFLDGILGYLLGHLH